MSSLIETMQASSRALGKLSAGATDAYAQNLDMLIRQVDQQLQAQPQLNALIGHNPREVLQDIHQKHAIFMSTAFRINSIELLLRTLPWMYRTYHARGFSYDYFSAELLAWQDAIGATLSDTKQKNEILSVYKWLSEQHEKMIQLSSNGQELAFSVRHQANEMQQVFQALLLQGDSQGCLKSAENSIGSTQELKHFYLGVIWPSLKKIGELWEANQISVAEEHLATAIVGRVMAALYPRVAQATVSRGKAVVTSGPNEFHEIGARMLADFMEMDGWDVTYRGASTPATEILAILKRIKPFVVALSIATVFNIENARQAIQMIKTDAETCSIKVLVGGHSFAGMPELWQTLGADGYADDAEGGLSVANQWWNSRRQ